MITVDGLYKSYKTFEVLKNISFTLQKGKITAILGHNGAGKTTLIKCLLQLTKYEGKINYDFPKEELYRHINVQMQTSSYEQNAKVIDICNLYKKILDVDISVDKLLESFDLIKFRNTYIHELSGGEKQKLSILLTIINNPKIVIYDEITTGLDVVARRKVWDLLKKIQVERDMTILITSHMLEEIEYLADELIILESGEVKLVTTVDEFIVQTFDQDKKIILKAITNEILQQIELMGIQVSQLNDAYVISTTMDKEQEIMQQLYTLGIKNIDCLSYSFEDAFMQRFGYKLNESGGERV